VEVSVGEDEGIRRGHILNVSRGKNYLGRLLVTHIAPDHAVGQILKDYSRGAIRTGDYVYTTN
ncbi:MAG: hypothetical protein AAFP90_06485, partial [Planctomycetota bacterium]